MTHTSEDIRNLLLSTKQLIPAEDIVVGLAIVNVKNQDLEVKRIINVSYPPDWLALYIERKYFLTDPVLQTHYRTFQTQIWSETYKKYSSPASPTVSMGKSGTCSLPKQSQSPGGGHSPVPGKPTKKNVKRRDRNRIPLTCSI